MDDVLFYNSFAFSRFRFTRYHYTDLRTGTRCHHIGYLRAGRAEFVCDGTRTVFTAGDVFFIPAGLSYQSYWYGEEAIDFDSYAFPLIPQAEKADYPLQKLKLSSRGMQALSALAEDRAVRAAKIGWLYALIGDALVHMERRGASRAEQLVSRARQIWTLDPTASIPEIASACAVSESGVYAAFRQVCKNTPIAEKHKIQCEQAALRLSTGDRPVEEIAAECGFSSASYLRKVLKEVYGKRPKDFRRPADL